MFLPSTCVICGTTGEVICPGCVAGLRRPPAFAPPDGLDSCAALLGYEGPARDLVVAVKYRNDRPVIGRLAAGLAVLACTPTDGPPDNRVGRRDAGIDCRTDFGHHLGDDVEQHLEGDIGRHRGQHLTDHTPERCADNVGGHIDIVTWAPTTAARRRERGYDQAELLARAVARHLHHPATRLLRRQPGEPQTGKVRADRLVGPAFDPVRPTAGRVLLIDDVITTGATMTAAAQVLRRAGAAAVHGLAVARTGPAADC